MNKRPYCWPIYGTDAPHAISRSDNLGGAGIVCILYEFLGHRESIRVVVKQRAESVRQRVRLSEAVLQLLRLQDFGHECRNAESLGRAARYIGVNQMKPVFNAGRQIARAVSCNNKRTQSQRCKGKGRQFV